MAKKTPVKKYTAKDLIQRLRVRYEDAQQYAFFEQVASGTGWKAQSWVDAMVLSLWPSKGLTRMAFEVKVHRADFIKELSSADKNEWAKEYCHEFWFVAPTNVIKEEELPEGVGWLRPHGDGLAIVRHASRHDANLDDVFMASLARSMIKQRERAMKSLRVDLLNTDTGHLSAVAHQEAVTRFVHSRGERLYGMESDKEEIFSVLEKASMTKKDVMEREHILREVDGMQQKLFELYEVFTIAAFVGLTETDDLGKRLGGAWDHRSQGIATARARKSLKGVRGKYERKRTEDLKQTFDLIIDRAKHLISELD